MLAWLRNTWERLKTTVGRISLSPWKRNPATYSRRRLRYVVNRVSERLENVRAPEMTQNLIPMLEVSGALVRGCRDAASGVLVLANANHYGGIVAAERTAWEIWNELDYLLLTDTPPDAAVKVQINGILEVLELLEKTDYAPESMISNYKNALAKFEKSHQSAVEEVKSQRKARKFHWSGKSRTSVVAPDELSKTAYKMLSWETHPDILSVRDVSAEMRGGVGILGFVASSDVDALVERAASSASECLLRSWNLFAQFWRQKPIEDAPPRKAG